ncbi:hypothetical protein POM88_040355 [Heracleum sosnowskyi]|uniref:Uncharacterized protein n=1 Tax=Heracleum sosnowskyi TaxID=360622 RepID=A0AAD8HCU3_9APIA|nr:hypothetical protein POM88_040355 [Heracleum sosnowskyi]
MHEYGRAGAGRQAGRAVPPCRAVPPVRAVPGAVFAPLTRERPGFCCGSCRRIGGVAHVEDFEAINDVARRADCERLALNFAKMLLKERKKFQTITEVVLAIQNSVHEDFYLNCGF